MKSNIKILFKFSFMMTTFVAKTAKEKRMELSHYTTHATPSFFFFFNLTEAGKWQWH